MHLPVKQAGKLIISDNVYLSPAKNEKKTMLHMDWPMFSFLRKENCQNLLTTVVLKILEPLIVIMATTNLTIICLVN